MLRHRLLNETQDWPKLTIAFTPIPWGRGFGSCVQFSQGQVKSSKRQSEALQTERSGVPHPASLPDLSGHSACPQERQFALLGGV
jgi:hypothetical protein